MPRINRVRLINYAWANRRIDDLILDFHGGMNAEIRLGNGGGKSVLQRLIFQSVHPNTTISGNRIEDYLKTKPAMTIVEWILDSDRRNQNRQLLTTGVLLSKSEAKDDSNSVVHSFTFISNDQNHLSIDNLPNVETGAGVIQIATYSASQTQFRNLTYNYPEIFYFASQDKKQYHQKLEEFGISANNWKETILPMISSEDPFSVFLKNSKTADQLINSYLLPKIETHISRTSDNRNNLLDQLHANVDTMAEQKENKDLRDLLAAYVKEEEPQKELLNRLIDTKKQQNHAGAVLVGFGHSVVQKIASVSDQLKELQQKLIQIEQKINGIEKEKVSYDWYQAKEDLDEAEHAYNENTEELQRLKADRDNVADALNHLEARRIFDECSALRGELQGLQRQLEHSGDSDRMKRLNQLNASLYDRYGTMIQALEQNAAAIQARIKQKQNQIDALEKETERKTKELLEINGKIAVLTTQKETYETKEQQLFNDISVTKPRRDLMNQLIPQEVAQIKEELSDRVRTAEQEIERLSAEIQKRKECLELDRKENEAVLINRFKSTELKKQKIADRELFKKRKADLLLNLTRYGISESQLYDAESLRAQWLQRKEANERNTDRLKFQKQLNTDLLLCANDHHVYIPQSVSMFLSEQGIEFQTGEKYLFEQSSSDRKKYLKQNPLLPFSLLMDRVNYEKMCALDLRGILIRQIIPVFTYGEFSRSDEGSDHLLYSVQEELLDRRRKEEYLSQIEKKIEKDQVQIDAFTAEKENIEQFRRSMEAFSYDQNDEEKLNHEIESAIEAIRACDDRIQSLKDEIEANENLKQAAERALNQQKEILKIQEAHCEAFRLFLDQTEPEYRNLLNDLTKKNQNYKTLQKELETAAVSMKQFREQKSAAEAENYAAAQELQKTKTKQNKYIYSGAYEAVQGETAALEEEYQTLMRESSSIQSLKQQIEKVNEQLYGKTQELEAKNIPEDELKDLRWTLNEVSRLKQSESACRQLIEECRRKRELIIDQQGKKREAFESTDRRLRSNGLEAPLRKEEILLHFEERKKEQNLLEEQTRNRMDTLKHESDALEMISAGLNAMRIDTEDSAEPVLLEEDFRDQFNRIDSEYKDLNENVKECRAEWLFAYRKLRNKYINRNPLFQKLYQNSSVIEEKEYPSLGDMMRWSESHELSMDTLHKKIAMYDTELAQLESGVSQMVRSVTAYTEMMIEALRRISRQSTLKLEDRVTPVRLLRIDLHENTPEASKRLEMYIREGIRRLADLAEEKSADLEKEMKILMNSRNMIGIYLDQQVIPVRVYRFDENSAHSGLVDWEKATKSNSTGEHSICCFVIIAVMMAYARESDPDLDDMRMERYEPLICDNPFASISSDYLVKPLIRIVDQLNLQLISFTHNTQQSIANQFDTVIQLRNTALKSGKNRVDIESESISEEKMEQASLFSSSKQLSMF